MKKAKKYAMRRLKRIHPRYRKGQRIRVRSNLGGHVWAIARTLNRGS